MSGDANITVDTVGTLNIGTASSNGITIGRSGQAVNFPGNVSITGNATGTSLQLSGALSGSSTLTIAGATTLQSSLNQSGGLATLGATTISGNAATTGNLTVQGALFDAAGNRYATSTSAGVLSLNSLTGVLIATGTPNQITVASSTGQLVFSLPQNINVTSAPSFSGLTVTGSLTLGSASTTGQLLFKNASTSFTTILQASSSQTSNLTFTLPNTLGTAGQAMLTDGTGNLYFGSTGSSQWLNGTSGAIYYSSGSVGINTTTPIALLSIIGSSSSPSLLFNVASSTGASLFNVASNGNVTIGNRVAATESLSGDAVQFVSASGNDSNDGLSWGTAKATPDAAISALPSCVSNYSGLTLPNCGTVYMGAGTWVRTATNSTLTVPNAVQLHGRGPSVTKIQASVASFPASTAVVNWSTPADTAWQDHGTVITDLSVDCNNVSGSTGILGATPGENSALERIYVSNCKADGINMDSGGVQNTTLTPELCAFAGARLKARA